jgi:hypothetical protein
MNLDQSKAKLQYLSYDVVLKNGKYLIIIEKNDVFEVLNKIVLDKNKIWNLKDPNISGDYICRMKNGYIKMCHWSGSIWLDMWKPTLDGFVIEWMNIPYD